MCVRLVRAGERCASGWYGGQGGGERVSAVRDLLCEDADGAVLLFVGAGLAEQRADLRRSARSARAPRRGEGGGMARARLGARTQHEPGDPTIVPSVVWRHVPRSSAQRKPGRGGAAAAAAGGLGGERCASGPCAG
jgi:hypothetical protein